MSYKRIFLLVMDSVGIGYDKMSASFGDEGANTLKHISEYVNGLNIPTMNSLGLGDLEDIKGTTKVDHPHSYVLKLNERSRGKDTMTGHWEMMGVETVHPFKTFTENGFPKELIDEIEKETGHKVIGNKAASGTDIMVELGEEQIRDNSLVVYTSCDSVLQIVASEEVTGLNEIYRVCEIVRKLTMKPEWMVGRVIARPFVGNSPETFKRTPNRHDYALLPPCETVLNVLNNNKVITVSVGKIGDIFSQYGIAHSFKTVSNSDGMKRTIEIAHDPDFYEGLCFINLVEFDSEYGHRRDTVGYAKALEQFDIELNELISSLHEDDLLMITADHGNDPTWTGTDHTREKVPLIIYSKKINDGRMLEERNSFADIGATILDNFRLCKPEHLIGEVIEEVNK